MIGFLDWFRNPLLHRTQAGSGTLSSLKSDPWSTAFALASHQDKSLISRLDGSRNPFIISRMPYDRGCWAAPALPSFFRLSFQRTPVMVPLSQPQGAGSVAQLVEQRTENPCVAGSIPARATFIINELCASFGRLRLTTVRFLSGFLGSRSSQQRSDRSGSENIRGDSA